MFDEPHVIVWCKAGGIREYYIGSVDQCLDNRFTRDLHDSKVAVYPTKELAATDKAALMSEYSFDTATLELVGFLAERDEIERQTRAEQKRIFDALGYEREDEASPALKEEITKIVQEEIRKNGFEAKLKRLHEWAQQDQARLNKIERWIKSSV